LNNISGVEPPDKAIVNGSFFFADPLIIWNISSAKFIANSDGEENIFTILSKFAEYFLSLILFLITNYMEDQLCSVS